MAGADSYSTSTPTTRGAYLDDLDEQQLYGHHKKLHPVGHRNHDEAFAEAVTRITTVAPWANQAPKFVVDMAQTAVSAGNLNDLLVDLRDADGFMATLRQRDQLAAAPDDVQAGMWRTMPRGVQQALRTQGYVPVEERPEPEASGGLAGALRTATSGIGSLPGMGVVGDIGQSVGMVAGGVWHGLGVVSNAPGALYRTARLDDGGMDSFDPGHFIDSWKRAWEGEKVFDPKVMSDVAERFDDEEAVEFVRRLAGGESVYEVAKTIVSHDDAVNVTPAYVDAVNQVLDFADNEMVRTAIGDLGKAKISPGRDLARTAGLEEGTLPFTVVSGAGDAAFQWFADPTLIVGKVNHLRLEAKLGLSLIKGDVVNRVHSFYGAALDARAAARTLTDVTDTRKYLAALGGADLNPAEKAATVIADHVRAKDFYRLQQIMPETSRLLVGLEQYAREVPIRTPTDVVKFFSGEAGLTAMISGDLAHYRYGFTTLPRLTRAGTVSARAKIAMKDSIDLFAQGTVKMSSALDEVDVAAGNLAGVQRAAGIVLSPMARMIDHAITLIPTHNYVVFGSRESGQLFDQLLNYGVRGETRRKLFNDFITAGTEAEARAVTSSALKTTFANLGLLDDPEYSPFVKRWLEQADQRFGFDDIDRNPHGGRSGIWPDADRADAVAFPAFREVVAEVRRQRLVKLITGWGGPDMVEPALRIWQPVAALPERFMRHWRPLAIGSPAKLAFGIRAGGEEALSQYARLGPGHLLKQWLTLPIQAADPGMTGWSRNTLAAGDWFFGLLPDAARVSAASGAEKTAQAVEANLARVIGRVAPISRAERRAYREHSFVDNVSRDFEEVGGHKAGMNALIGEATPDSFLTTSEMQHGRAVEIAWRKIDGPYDEFVVADEFGRRRFAETARHVGTDRVARARLKVRTVFVDEQQAGRIAGGLGTRRGAQGRFLSNEPFTVVADVRRQLGELPGPVRAKLVRWVDHDDAEALAYLKASNLGPSTDNVIDRMAALNRSDRRALLANPAEAFGDIERPSWAQWDDLLERVQRGDVDAWHQLENEVGVAQMSSGDLAAHVKGMDRAGPEFSVDRGEALRLWSETQRQSLDQITMRDGQVIHGISGSLADDAFDVHRHVLDADYAVPDRGWGPQVERVDEPRGLQALHQRFFDRTGKMITAMARQPLWQHAYAQAYAEADHTLSPFLRPAHLVADGKRIFGDGLDDASDLLFELEHRMEEAHRAGHDAARVLGDLDDTDLLTTLAGHGLKVDEAQVPALRRWWANERQARDRLSHIASTRATTDVVPYIDDHRIRSQAAEMGRNAVPFWFAQEQFYKRWARTFRQSPEAIERVRLANHAMYANGWVEPDANGNGMFVYPGGSFTNQVIAKAADLLPGKTNYSLPVAMALTGQLTMAIPGFDDLTAPPQAGPLIAAPIAFLRDLVPGVGVPLENALVNRRGQGKDFASAVLPTNVKRLWDLTLGWDDSVMPGATLAAMQMLEASGHGLPQNASAADQQVWQDRLRSWTRVLGITRTLYGLVGPASPQLDLDPDDLNQEFQDLLHAGIPLEEAHERFMRAHPDATAWTVFASQSPTKAPTNPTDDALQVLTDHADFFEKYRSSAAWLLPQTAPGDDSFNQQAWREMMANGIRDRKGTNEMWRDIKYAEGAPEFFANADKVEAALANAGTVDVRKRIRAYWRDWKENYLAMHPVFREEYLFSKESKETRDRVLRELPQALDDPDVPDVAHADELRELVGNFESTRRRIEESANDTSDAGAARRRRLKEFFADWAAGYVAGNPTVEAFYLRIIKPELDLPEVRDDEES